jgi:hypothetical protein
MPVQNRLTKVKRVKKSRDRSDPLPKPDRPIVYPGVFPQLILQPSLRPTDVSPVEAEEVAEDVAEDVAEESRTVRTWVEDKRDTPVGPI